jgi:hypothetical protein
MRRDWTREWQGSFLKVIIMLFAIVEGNGMPMGFYARYGYVAVMINGYRTSKVRRYEVLASNARASGQTTYEDKTSKQETTCYFTLSYDVYVLRGKIEK